MICLYDEATSTNSIARAEGHAIPNLSAIMAIRQTSGYGKAGRVWESKEGNVAVSYILKPTVKQSFRETKNLGILSFLVSLAVHRTLSKLPIDGVIQCKWPNDIMINGKKVAGILLEAETQHHQVEYVVAGIGINNTHHPSTIPSTAIINHSPKPTSALWIASNIKESLLWYENILDTEGSEELINQWKSVAQGLGEEVSVQTGDIRIKGRMTNITTDGILVLTDDEGKIHNLHSGDVFFKENK